MRAPIPSFQLLLLDQFDVQLNLCIIGNNCIARFQIAVPDKPEILPMDCSGSGKAATRLAIGVLLLFAWAVERQGHALGDAVDREVAYELQLSVVIGKAFADEGHLRILSNVKEVRALQMGIALRNSGV